MGSLYEEYKKRVYKKGENPKKVLDDLKITRYCCRKTILAHPLVKHGDDVYELADEAAQYE
jgi:DNA-directed RNA polymerase subunit N